MPLIVQFKKLSEKVFSILIIEDYAHVVVMGMKGVGKIRLIFRYITKCYMLYSSFDCEEHWNRIELINNKKIDVDITLLKYMDSEYDFWNRLLFSLSNCFIFVFSVDSNESFLAFPRYLAEIEKNRNTEYRIIAVVNKIDLHEGLWKVNRNEYRRFFGDQGIALFEVSALSGECVDDAFCYSFTESNNIFHREKKNGNKQGPKDILFFQ